MMERCYKIKYKKVVPANIHGDPTFDDINNQDPNCDDQLEENIECTCTCREQSQINKQVLIDQKIQLQLQEGYDPR